jgi:hypothetical protein
MKILKLFIPGDFEDAQLYMGHLLAFTTDRRLEMVELEPLTHDLDERYPSWRGLLTLAFARNDWLRTSQFHTLMSNDDFAVSVRRALETYPTDGVSTDATETADELPGFSVEGDVLLETLFYASRMYVGTDAGFYDFDVDWQTKDVRRSRKRLDARCISASAEYGAVNASCEDDGLFTGYDEFGWGAAADGGELRHTAQRSLRTAWLRTDLVNYESLTHSSLLKGRTEEVDAADGGARRTRKVVTDLSVERESLDFLLEKVSQRKNIDLDEVQFVWNSSGAFFINTYDRGFFTVIWSRRDSQEKERVIVTEYPGVMGRVVSVHRSGVGVVVERDFACHLFHKGSFIPLLETEVLSVRTFNSSKRYRNLVAATAEDGVYLIAMLDI